MLSENKMKPCYLKHTLPELPTPKNIRIKFSKTGNLQYISHLDLQRTLVKVLVRAGIPVWYTKGFNPHAKMVFAMPLSVGTESECEFLDIKLDRDLSCEKIKEQLTNELTDELQILEVYEPESKFSDIAYAEYDFEIWLEEGTEKLCDSVRELLSSSEINVIKKTKSGERETDIAPLILSSDVCFDGDSGRLKIKAVLSANMDNFLNPELLMTVIKDRLNILGEVSTKEGYNVFRRRVLTSDGKTEFR